MGKYLIALQLAVVGMGTVLITLYGLSLFIRLNSRICSGKSSNKSLKKQKQEEKANIADNKVIEKGISASKVAVISAAIYSYLDKEESNYQIISITRNKANWKR